MLHRKARAAAPDRGDDFRQDGIRRPCARGKASEVVGAETLQKFVEAGTVVTRDIPDNVVAYGNPCRVVRLNER